MCWVNVPLLECVCRSCWGGENDALYCKYVCVMVFIDDGTSDDVCEVWVKKQGEKAIQSANHHPHSLSSPLLALSLCF